MSRTPERNKQGEYVKNIKQWMLKESHLPNDFDDILTTKFLHSCYWSMERTKQCIDKFCTTRSHMNDVYIGRDPLIPRVQTGLSITHIGCYRTPDNQEMLIHQVNDPGLEKFAFYDVIKAFTLIGDCWMNETDFLAEGHIVILDIKDYTMKIISKINIIFLRDFFIYLLEATPVRLKQLHVINCPPYVDKLYALVKPVLPAEICDLINFHSSHEGLYKFIDKNSLPIEYGGAAGSLVEQNKDWNKKVEKNRDYWINDALWKADLKKRPKDAAAVNIMNGSFRKLDID